MYALKLFEQNPPVLNWEYQLTQINLYNGCKTVTVVVYSYSHITCHHVLLISKCGSLINYRTRHRVSTSMYLLTFRVCVTTPPAVWTKWNSLVEHNVANAAGASILSLVRGVFAGMRSVCGMRWAWQLPPISSVAIATQSARIALLWQH